MQRKREAEEQLRQKKKPKTVQHDGDEDQVKLALQKILRFVGVPSKFDKAAQLVLGLLHEKHVSCIHANLLFNVLSCSLLNRDACLKTPFRKKYCKLVSAAVKYAHWFTESQKKQIEVYQLWTLCRNELLTDDSFVFGKNMSKLKELTSQMSFAIDEDEEALTHWREKIAALKVHYEDNRRLDVELFTDDMSLVWTEAECLAARREALLDWLEGAREPYIKHQWACAAVDLAIKVFNENRQRFCKAQQSKIDELVRFSKDQKSRRQQGPSFKEKKRDSTVFEEARKEWSKAQVSHRGMVGNEGDHRSEAWLG